MKTGKRSYPLDQLSVSEDGVSVSIHTHRQSVVISINDVAVGGAKRTQTLTLHFQEFKTLIEDAMVSHPDSEVYFERSRYTGVEEGK